MVFNSVSETETPPLPPPTTTTTTTFNPKSQPLHNFPLNLKWSVNQSTTHRFRRVPDPTRLSPIQNRPLSPLSNDANRSPIGDSGSGRNPTENSSGSVDSGPGEPVVSDGDGVVEEEEEEESKSASSVEISEGKASVGNVRGGVEKVKLGFEGKSKAFVRFSGRNKGYGYDAIDDVEFSVEDGERMVKTWNLRPRRAVTKPPNPNGGVAAPASKPVAQSRPEMAPARVAAAAAAAEEKVSQKKVMFSVSLMKEEIEEDFLRMTGARPPKRPKKRARNVQKHLDMTFPGLWLTSVTPDLYRIPDPPLKG